MGLNRPVPLSIWVWFDFGLSYLATPPDRAVPSKKVPAENLPKAESPTCRLPVCGWTKTTAGSNHSIVVKYILGILLGQSQVKGLVAIFFVPRLAAIVCGFNLQKRCKTSAKREVFFPLNVMAEHIFQQLFAKIHLASAKMCFTKHMNSM